MLGSRASLILSVLVGIVVGVGHPYVDLALACREAASEACVWGKAYFSLTLGVSLVLIGGVSAGVTYALLAWWRRRRKRGDAASQVVRGGPSAGSG